MIRHRMLTAAIMTAAATTHTYQMIWGHIRGLVIFSRQIVISLLVMGSIATAQVDSLLLLVC